MAKFLVTGSSGQVGSELVEALAKKAGKENVIGLDLREPGSRESLGAFEKVDATDKTAVENAIKKHGIETVYALASILSAIGEQKPNLAWNVNINSLKNVLDLAKEHSLKVFWPSSIAIFGPNTPKENTPQETVLCPNTMYGITKVTGELLCNYYFEKFGVDVRCLRYPGLISYKTKPGGGTTDYAVDIFYQALKRKSYQCFLKKETVLPMMYMPDALRASFTLMDAKPEKVKIRHGYNLAAMSFSAGELVEEIKKHVPEFECTFVPDERQKIADSWPRSIDDSRAREDWNWAPEFDLEKMAKDMLEKLAVKQETGKMEVVE